MKLSADNLSAFRDKTIASPFCISYQLERSSQTELDNLRYIQIIGSDNNQLDAVIRGYLIKVWSN